MYSNFRIPQIQHSSTKCTLNLPIFLLRELRNVLKKGKWENLSTFQGLRAIVKYFSRPIWFSRTFQDSHSFSSIFQDYANPDNAVPLVRLEPATTQSIVKHSTTGSLLLFVCLFCCFTSHVNSYGHGGTVSTPNQTFSWASLNKRLTSTSCTYFRL